VSENISLFTNVVRNHALQKAKVSKELAEKMCANID
jgi:hypothetical protein